MLALYMVNPNLICITSYDWLPAPPVVISAIRIMNKIGALLVMVPKQQKRRKYRLELNVYYLHDNINVKHIAYSHIHSHKR